MSALGTARKDSFWRRFEQHGIHRQARLTMHCKANNDKAFSVLPSDNKLVSHSCTKPKPPAQSQSFLTTISKPLAFRFCELRWDLSPQKRAKSSYPLRLFGIHFGISSCTALKDQLKQSLKATSQAYFTILFTVFHGKKAAKITKKPSNESFFAILIRNFSVFSAFL